MKTYIVDFDDFCIETEKFSLSSLMHLKRGEPNFKATLMCIPEQTPKELLSVINKTDWLEPAMHGWFHRNLECGGWSKKYASDRLRDAERLGYAKVFRAPHWEVSDGLYEACFDAGWILCDHPKNKGRRILGSLIYDIEDWPGQAQHGHIDYADSGNSLRHDIEKYEALHGGFKFISELPAEMLRFGGKPPIKSSKEVSHVKSSQEQKRRKPEQPKRQRHLGPKRGADRSHLS